jgi:hypothetical protein
MRIGRGGRWQRNATLDQRAAWSLISFRIAAAGPFLSQEGARMAMATLGLCELPELRVSLPQAWCYEEARHGNVGISKLLEPITCRWVPG